MTTLAFAALLALSGYEANTHGTLALPQALCRDLNLALDQTTESQVQAAVRCAVVATQGVQTNGCDDDRFTLDSSFYYEVLSNLDSSRCMNGGEK